MPLVSPLATSDPNSGTRWADGRYVLMPLGRKRLQTAFYWQLLFSRILNEITLILDTLHRSNHLSVETVHPLLNYLDALSPRAWGHAKSNETKPEIFRLIPSQLRLSTVTAISVFVHRPQPRVASILKVYPKWVGRPDCNQSLSYVQFSVQVKEPP